MADDKPNDINKRPYSSLVVDGNEKAAARAMLYAVGFTEEDFGKSQVGIASTWSNLTPCNMHINELAEAAAMGRRERCAVRGAKWEELSGRSAVRGACT